MEFSRTAPYYHLLERCFIGNALQNTRIAQLERLSFGEKSSRVLIVGEGNGRFLQALLQRYPDVDVVVIDESARMLERARRRLEQAGISADGVAFKVADLRALDLGEGEFDVIVTHFFFTNFAESDVARMVAALARAARTEAEWLIGDFTLPNRRWPRLRARLWLAILYRFFGWTAGVPVRELPEIERYVVDQGFRLDRAACLSAGMLRSDYFRRA